MCDAAKGNETMTWTPTAKQEMRHTVNVLEQMKQCLNYYRKERLREHEARIGLASATDSVEHYGKEIRKLLSPEAMAAVEAVIDDEIEKTMAERHPFG
jgi:hypothetical protein